VGNVVEVRVPDDGCEAARDLSRALDDAREDLKRVSGSVKVNTSA